MKHLFTLFFIFIWGVQTQAQNTLINETFEAGWAAGDNVLKAGSVAGSPADNLGLQGWEMVLLLPWLMKLEMGLLPQISLEK
jgi:hypothetical protein